MFAGVSCLFGCVSGFLETNLSFHNVDSNVFNVLSQQSCYSCAFLLSFFFFKCIDFFHYLSWVMLNRSKWCSEMYKNDGPPRAMNNSRDLHSLWIHLKSSPCKIHGKYVNGNVITYPLRIYGCVHMHTNVFMTVIPALANWFEQVEAPILAPALLPHQLSATMLAAALWHVGCRWPSCVTLPGQGQPLPVRDNCHNFPHDTFILTSLIH